MADPTIGPELALLAKDVGEWDADLTITPGPGAPPQLSKGHLTGRLISGGRWLVLDFKNHTTGFEGCGIFGYNPAAKRYVGTWVDDMRTNIHVGEGEWDPATRTMTYNWSAPMAEGKVMTWRETTQDLSDREKLYRVLFPLPDGGDFEMMRVTYVRS